MVSQSLSDFFKIMDHGSKKRCLFSCQYVLTILSIFLLASKEVLANAGVNCIFFGLVLPSKSLLSELSSTAQCFRACSTKGDTELHLFNISVGEYAGSTFKYFFFRRIFRSLSTNYFSIIGSA